MELKINENTVIRINNNQAEIIADKTYKLVIFLEKNKVIASYSNLTLTIEYNKFDTEKLARKIYSIVKSTHKFSIIVIQKTLAMLSIDQFYSDVLRKLKNAKENGNIELLLKIYELLSNNK